MSASTSRPAPAVRRIGPADAETFLDLDTLVWASDERAPRERLLASVPVRAGFVAELDGEPVGQVGSWDVELGIPDGRGGARLVPAEGVTWANVHPDHRRRGVLSTLIAHHLRWTRDEQRRSIAVLKASEPGIYGRFGYGVASTVIRSSFAKGTTFAAPAAVTELADATVLRTQTATPEMAVRARDCWRACATGRPGQVVRALDDLTRLLTDVPEQRGEREPNRILWATRDGADVGFALFRRSSRWEEELPAGSADVWVVASADPAARLALARRLTDLDLVTSTGWWVTPDDPLAMWLPSPRSLPGGLSDSVWLRIADLPMAVAQRGHAADLDLVVEVRDPLLPEQAGTWRWTAAGGEGGVARHDGEADLSLGIGDLGAVWLGGQTLGARAAAGHLTERTPGAVAALDAALRTPTGPEQTPDF